MKSILANYETANFAELLALLLEYQVTYPKALVLASQSTGNSRIARGAASRSPRRSAAASRPTRRWQRSTGARFCRCCAGFLQRATKQGSLSGALRNLAGHYRKRGRHQAEKLALLLPTVLMIAIGASATLFYALALFIPVVNLLKQLSSF